MITKTITRKKVAPVTKKKVVVKKKTAPKKVKILPMPMMDTRNGNLYYGCDPEFFLKKDGKIVGSEKYIPEEGITRYPEHRDYYSNEIIPAEGPITVIRDGIQVEINPEPSFCRELLQENIERTFHRLNDEVLSKNPDVSVDYSVTVDITKEEMDSLSEKSKTFGCTPSYNLYDTRADVGVKDASKYFSRSAGGHIHIGGHKNAGESSVSVEFLQNPARIIPVLDLIVGNTCVLVDRDPGNKKRRETYGRAGEYRLPKHGIEYRTLSNFWLRDYALMSMVFGLVRQAILIVWKSNEEHDYAKELMSMVNIDDVRNAINNNDRELALKNFNKIKDFMIEIGRSQRDTPDVLSHTTMEDFEYFISKPIEHWFPSTDIVGAWLKDYSDDDCYGIESFLSNVVHLERTGRIADYW